MVTPNKKEAKANLKEDTTVESLWTFQAVRSLRIDSIRFYIWNTKHSTIQRLTKQSLPASLLKPKKIDFSIPR